MNRDNKPLTLEELRKMDGQPVWGVSLASGKPGEWFIVRVVEMSKCWFIACAGASQGFGDKDTYGKTWLAYAYKPDDLLTRADKAMEDTITLYLVEHDADDRKRWRSFNKLIHQRKQQLESAQQQLEGVLDMFENERRGTI